MKNIIIAFAALILCTSLSHSSYVNIVHKQKEIKGAIENKINETINDIVSKISDPLEVPDISIVLPGDTNISEDVIHGGINITSLRISGIKTLVASSINYDLLRSKIALTLDISELYITTKWWADMAVLDLIPLYGDGRMTFNFEDVELQLSSGIDLLQVSLNDLELVFNLEDATFDLHGLINNEEFSALVSAAFNDNFVKFVKEYQAVITNILSPIAEKIINEILENRSTTTAAPATTTPEGSGGDDTFMDYSDSVQLFFEQLERL